MLANIFLAAGLLIVVVGILFFAAAGYLAYLIGLMVGDTFKPDKDTWNFK